MSSNPHIYGIHDPGGEALLSGRGWVVFTEEIGADPDKIKPTSYQYYVDQGLGVITRLNYSYGKGTLPPRDQYSAFAQCCANFVRNSRGCTTWIIGNEPNHAQEGAIPFDAYADGFNQAANAIRRVQPGAPVLMAAVAPWNMDAGDWLFYFAQAARLCHCDGFALHTYTHDVDPALIYSDAKMQSHPDRFFEFKAYRDFMSAIPANKRHLPAYITEADQDKPWANVNSGWVQNAYAEIDWWNHQPGHQQIRCLALYRWPNHDQWGFCDKPGVQDDLRAAVAKGYQWRQEPQPAICPAPPTRIGYVTASPYLRLRSEPSTTGDVLAEVPTGAQITVSGERAGWLQVTYGGQPGWMAKTWVSDQAPAINDESTVDQRSAIIAKLAAEYGVDERVAKAVIKVESGGAGFRNGRLIIRFEPHVFKSQLDAAFNRQFTLGVPSWNGDQHRHNGQPFHGNQDAEYKALEDANAAIVDAAYKSASYGAGQILGINHGMIGYPSAQAMMDAFQQSEEAQLRAMFVYWQNSGALACLKTGDYVGFSRIYNGEAQPQKYANDILEAMAK